jgi:hypothetical protein
MVLSQSFDVRGKTREVQRAVVMKWGGREGHDAFGQSRLESVG